MARHSLGPLHLDHWQRVNIVGVSGSGKSTLGRQLAQLLGHPFYEMDALFWKPNWTESEDDEFFAKVQGVVDQEHWVLDGNYSRSQTVKWPRVQTVVWLNFSFWRTTYQITRRCLQRAWDQRELWPGTGNRESFRLSFFSKESVLWYSVRNYHRVQKRYLAMLNDPQYSHLHFVRLQTPAEVASLLHELGNAVSAKPAATDPDAHSDQD